MVAPLLGIGQCPDRLVIDEGVSEAQLTQCGHSLGQGVRPLWPIPDKQADIHTIVHRQIAACHQAGHGPAGVQAAAAGLDMGLQVPVQLALDHQVYRLAQSLRDGADLARIRGPVVSLDTIATADCLMQAPLAVNQGYRHAVDFRLGPDVLSTVQPSPYGVGILEFLQAGMDNGVRHLSARGAQRLVGRREVETAAPLAQLCAGLIIQFIGHQRLAEAMITVVPGIDLLLQRGDFGTGAFSGPVGAGRGDCGKGDADKTGECIQKRWHRSILARLSTEG